MDFSKPQLIFAITWCLAFGLSALIETNCRLLSRSRSTS